MASLRSGRWLVVGEVHAFGSLKRDHLVGPERPVDQLLQGGAARAVDELGFLQTPSIQTGAAAPPTSTLAGAGVGFAQDP
jgi:hypothetical protein